MDYDKIFEGDLNKKFFYTDYPGNKMVAGKISLKNAIERLDKNEYYVLVTYHEGETLPEQYMPLPELKSDDGTLFATLNPNIRLTDICHDYSIQRISRLPNKEEEAPNYLLGPGPETITLDDLIMEQYNKYYGNEKNMSR